jgi:hypothetical protein
MLEQEKITALYFHTIYQQRKNGKIPAFAGRVSR